VNYLQVKMNKGQRLKVEVESPLVYSKYHLIVVGAGKVL
jgi:hypothetical protein